MDTSTENATEKSLETISEQETVLRKKPVSVYSVSFSQILNDAEREFLIEHSKTRKPEKPVPQSSISKAIFNWRNGIAIAAILAVGVLHFAFQLSFIQTESAQTERLPEIPPTTSSPPSSRGPWRADFQAADRPAYWRAIQGFAQP